MPDIQLITGASSPERKTPMTTKVTHSLAAVCALAFFTVGAAPVSAASVSRSVDVNGTPAAVWSMIGPFCAIKDWHPAIGTCTEDGKSPPTRTLVTKDGKATFVEPQTARSDTTHQYSYSIKSSPLPITNYKSTLKVTGKSKDISTVTWTGTYTPDHGKEKGANDALAGIYGAGLDAIKTKLTK